ncbi:MAG: hypothetical protein ACKOAR_03960 [Bacteroidota bacterium]
MLNHYFNLPYNAAGTRLPGSSGLYYWGGANNTHFFVDPKEKLIAILMTQESHFSWNWHDKLRQLVYQSVAD